MMLHFKVCTIYITLDTPLIFSWEKVWKLKRVAFSYIYINLKHTFTVVRRRLNVSRAYFMFLFSFPLLSHIFTANFRILVKTTLYNFWDLRGLPKFLKEWYLRFLRTFPDSVTELTSKLIIYCFGYPYEYMYFVVKFITKINLNEHLNYVKWFKLTSFKCMHILCTCVRKTIS